MKSVDYQRFSLRFHQHATAARKRIPLNATVELTYRCNNRCVHCYCNLPVSDMQARAAEFSFEEVQVLFYELQQQGTLWLLLTGGEPLLREDFKDIYIEAKRHGFLITVFTNATLVNKDIVALFKRYPPFMVEVTMYGATEQTYERITRVKGSYRAYWQGLQMLVEEGIRVRLKTSVLSLNKHELSQIKELASSLGCHFRFDPLLHRRIDGRGLSQPEKYRIAPEEVVRLDMAFRDRLQELELFCEKMLHTAVSSERLLNCGAGMTSVHITPYADVLPCSMLTDMKVSLRDKPFSEIWQTDLARKISTTKDFTLDCDGCELINLCGHCAGWSLLEHGRMDRKVEYLCRIAHQRAAEFPFIRCRPALK